MILFSKNIICGYSRGFLGEGRRIHLNCDIMISGRNLRLSYRSKQNNRQRIDSTVLTVCVFVRWRQLSVGYSPSVAPVAVERCIL